MKTTINSLAVLSAIILITAGFTGSAAAQRRDERQIRDLVRSLNSQIDNFQSTLENELQSSSADRQDIDDAANALGSLQQKVTAFENNFNQRRENRDDVNQIVEAERNIDVFLRRDQQNQKIQRDWDTIKNTIARLSGSYGVTPSRNSAANSTSTATGRNTYPARPTVGGNSQLTGTYHLDASRSENTDQIITESNVSSTQRDDLRKKLEAPDQIAIDIRGNQVTLSSSIASPATFVADGSEKTETDAGGRTVRLRATLRGQELTISSLGGESDYTVIFTPTDNGRSLRVTRRITTEYLSQTVFADSVYQKIDAVAGLGIDTNDQNTGGGWSSNDRNQPAGSGPVFTGSRSGEYIVPNGTIITGQLESTIDTKVSQNNDRFRLTVQTPDEFRGAVIEGYITGVGRSGRVSGSSNVTFNFEKITLRDGKSYDFSGFLQAIKDQNGKTVKVDNEGTAKGGSQTRETAKRGGIGAGLGAVIGAIAGGGTGAAVGAIIGGSVGAGSVIVQGRDDVQLMKGSTMTVQASSPIRDDRPSDN